MDISASHGQSCFSPRVSPHVHLIISYIYIYITMFIGECSMFSDPTPPKTIQQKLAINAVKPMKSPLKNPSKRKPPLDFHEGRPRRAWFRPARARSAWPGPAEAPAGVGLAGWPDRDDDGLGKYPMAIDIQ